MLLLRAVQIGLGLVDSPLTAISLSLPSCLLLRFFAITTLPLSFVRLSGLLIRRLAGRRGRFRTLANERFQGGLLPHVLAEVLRQLQTTPPAAPPFGTVAVTGLGEFENEPTPSLQPVSCKTGATAGTRAGGSTRGFVGANDAGLRVLHRSDDIVPNATAMEQRAAGMGAGRYLCQAGAL
jgi:hypothetical protein